MKESTRQMIQWKKLLKEGIKRWSTSARWRRRWHGWAWLWWQPPGSPSQTPRLACPLLPDTPGGRDLWNINIHFILSFSHTSLNQHRWENYCPRATQALLNFFSFIFFSLLCLMIEWDRKEGNQQKKNFINSRFKTSEWKPVLCWHAN